MRVGYQTGLPLKTNQPIQIPARHDNLIPILDELIRRNITPIYLINSKDVFLKDCCPLANAFVLEKQQEAFNDYRDFEITQESVLSRKRRVF